MSKNKSDHLSLGEVIKTIVITFVIYYFIFNILLVNSVIPSGSMMNTINIGDKVLADRVFYRINGIERGDIIIFSHESNHNYLIKRVIGLPGETIEGKDGYVYINGNKLTETYVKDLLDEDFGPYIVPENCYFMMGDNRTNSLDSRYWDKKFIRSDAIVGKALFKYLSDFEFFKKPDYSIK